MLSHRQGSTGYYPGKQPADPMDLTVETKGPNVKWIGPGPWT